VFSWKTGGTVTRITQTEDILPAPPHIGAHFAAGASASGKKIY
jgi:hypothetical protein